jgi:shikimate dehydrogenase
VTALLDDIAPDAKLIGAVNTVRREGDRLIGENTDGKGFLHCLRESGVYLRGKRITLLGAGGAARAISVELALAGAAELTVINRSAKRGRTLVADLNSRAQANLRFQPWNATFTIGPEVDVLVNVTSIGLHPDIDAEPAVELKSARSDLLVCDVICYPPETRLVRAARAQGLNTVTGLPMLVYQGAIGFRMWTCQPAPEGPMKRTLEQAFGLTV